jgi:hypothetical protein
MYIILAIHEAKYKGTSMFMCCPSATAYTVAPRVSLVPQKFAAPKANALQDFSCATRKEVSSIIVLIRAATVLVLMATLIMSDVPPRGLDGAIAEIALFEHPRLDYAIEAIRLITISPQLSATGLIQCSTVHVTIPEVDYVCLSYRWGPLVPVKMILMNGKLFVIRQNLFDFLVYVRPAWNKLL